MTEPQAAAITAFDQFVRAYQAKYSETVARLTKDPEAMLAFLDFLAEHWIHIRSSNVIESTFATIRHRTDRTRGCLTRTGMLAMLFKLAISAEHGWRKLRGVKTLAKGIRGVKVRDGIEVRPERRTSLRQAGSRVAA